VQDELLEHLFPSEITDMPGPQPQPPCRVRQHYDATIAGRSFHIL
jgi:hypothetical protein